MLTTYSTDGTEVRAYDEGQGPPVILVGPGMDDGTRGAKIASILSEGFRVLRPHRRQYRLDLKGGSPITVADEVEDIRALTRAVGAPAVLYGHSSGGVVALETLVAAPSAFSGAVIFEPPALTGPPLAGPKGEVLRRARTAASTGRPGEALTIFSRDVVGLPAWKARLAGRIGSLVPHYRRLIPCQLDDLEAMDQLGVRLAAYTQIKVPMILLAGDRSPAHVLDRLHALGRAMPHSHMVTMRGRDHGADVKAPTAVAQVIELLTDEVVRPSG